METTEHTAQGIVDAIREMLGLEGDTDVLEAVSQLRNDERTAHIDWRDAEAKVKRLQRLLESRK